MGMRNYLLSTGQAEEGSLKAIRRWNQRERLDIQMIGRMQSDIGVIDLDSRLLRLTKHSLLAEMIWKRMGNH